MYRNGKLDSLWGSVMPKIRSILKKASNKSCSELNFVQKSSGAHMSSSPTCEAWEFKRSVYLKSYNVQKWDIRFTLGLNATKNTHYIKKASNESCSKLNSYKKVSRHICLSPPGEWNQGSFPFLYIIRFQMYRSLEPAAPLLREIDIRARGLFCMKFNSEQLLFEVLFM